MLQWTWTESPRYGSESGTIVALKHLTLGTVEIAYVTMGGTMAWRLVRRLEAQKSVSSRGPGAPPLRFSFGNFGFLRRDGGGSDRGSDGGGGGRIRSSTSVATGSAKLAALQKTSQTVKRYLVVVSAIGLGVVAHRVEQAWRRWGTTAYERMPCDLTSYYEPTTHHIPILVLVLFGLICAPDSWDASWSGGGCACGLRQLCGCASGRWSQHKSMMAPRSSSSFPQSPQSPQSPSPSLTSPSMKPSTEASGGKFVANPMGKSVAWSDSVKGSGGSDEEVPQRLTSRRGSSWKYWTEEDPPLLEDLEEERQAVKVEIARRKSAADMAEAVKAVGTSFIAEI